MIRCCFFIGLALFVVGCSTPQYRPPSIKQADIRAEYDRQNAERKEEFRKSLLNRESQEERLANLSYPLRVAAAIYSEDSQVAPEFGFSTLSIEDLRDEPEPYKKDVYYEVYDLSSPSSRTITFIVDNSPAQRAGLKVGDRIIAVDGKKFKDKKEFGRFVTLDLYLYFGPYIPPKAKRWFPVKTFTVVRDSDTIDIPIRPTRVSKYRVRLTKNKKVAAFANGVSVYISKGMMDFVESDEELQYIIAHELAHNVEQHLEKRKDNAFLAGLIGATLDVFFARYTGIYVGLEGVGIRDGVYMYSKDFERESDYLAMYMLANAGISTSKVADIWRRMSEKDGDSAIYSLTHPSYSERYLSLLSVDREIQEKRRAGLPIRPNKGWKNDSFIKLRPNVIKK